jgi:hypothetical protein
MIALPRISRGTFRLWQPAVLQAAVIVFAVLWIYSPVFHGDWLWDDNRLITENPLMKEPDGLW